MENRNKILKSYDENLELNKSCLSKLVPLIKDLISSSDLVPHSIEGRIKERYSLERKITDKNKYYSISDITDVIGIRAIAHFEDEVDLISNILKKEFKVDSKNSTDKRLKEYDRFGYASNHFVLGLGPERMRLTEYNRYTDIKFEVQVRTILQHAWAEIEHDIGYKSKEDIPIIAKRNFSRISALLEIADLEFTNLRKTLVDYKANVKSEIKKDSGQVDLNKISLQSFIEGNNLVDTLDKELADGVQASVSKINSDLSYTISKLRYLGFRTIKELETSLNENKSILIPFSILFVNLFDKESGITKNRGLFQRGFSIFYLIYLLLASKKQKELEEYFKIYPLSNENKVIRLLRKSYKQSRKSDS